MNEHFILDADHNAIEVDLMTWARWFEKGDRIIGGTYLPDCHVSTVFIGLDHSFGHGPPLLFETMVFGGPLDGEQERYTTWAEAEAGHQVMVAKAEQGT